MGSYDYFYKEAIPDEGIAFSIFGVLLVIYLLVLAFGIVSYVLQSLGMYTIAKRRGINNPWLAWLPVGNMWVLGSISDQYQYVAKGQVRNRRKILLGLSIASIAMVVPALIAYVGLIASAISDSGIGMAYSTLGVVILLFIGLLAVEVTLAVFQYIALYDLYMSCDPGTGVIYLILSILFRVALPFFVFFSRKKELGMPARRQQIPVTEQPGWRPNAGQWPPVPTWQPGGAAQVTPPAEQPLVQPDASAAAPVSQTPPETQQSPEQAAEETPAQIPEDGSETGRTQSDSQA